MRAMLIVTRITLPAQNPICARIGATPVVTEVRCPYCIVGGFGFRKMIKNSYDHYVCPTLRPCAEPTVRVRLHPMP